jgi:hypothetical protein
MFKTAYLDEYPLTWIEGSAVMYGGEPSSITSMITCSIQTANFLQPGNVISQPDTTIM